MNKLPSPGKDAPKVSIVIPAYNREKYVGIAIKSVLDQTYRDFELIIVDDGSTDGTLEMAQNFALHDSRIRVLTAPHQGAVYALIAGFNAASGEYIGQLDSDDLLEPEAIELTVKALDAHPKWGMVYTNYRDIDGNGQLTSVGWRCSIPYSKQTLLTAFMTFHFRLMRKAIYKQVGGFNTDFNKIEDYELCLRLSEVIEIGKVDEFLYQYRQHSESISSTSKLEMILLMEKASNIALKRRGLDDIYRLKILYNPTMSLELIR
jgi:glycosyltransferase involved in cell wall biosynthesis